MRTTYDLSTLSWELTGWHPLFWKAGITQEAGFTLHADVHAVPANVPGSVQQALRQAGVLPDWNVGTNSRDCEWVENRHWVYQAYLPAAWLQGGEQVCLHCEGLDYQGHLYINGQPAGDFCGTYIPHHFDITPYLSDGDTRITLIFTDNPRYLGQIGYTSQMTEWKPRFNYVWDWVPRLVQIGIWDAIRLEVRAGDAIDGFSCYPDYDVSSGLGTVQFTAELAHREGATLEIALLDGETVLGATTLPAAVETSGTLQDLPVSAWQPNGNGRQPRYTVRARLLDAAGAVLDETGRPTGFREITWQPCLGAPEGAEPWICRVNGVDTFLQGANWVPMLPNFADVGAEDYRRLLTVYRDAGFNLLRVWGGAVLEREVFYDLCDELGLLVWQEFPLSSSGIENYPPDAPQAIAEMTAIARGYITRRQHHPSLLLWCGGNELMGTKDDGWRKNGVVIDVTHPMLAAFATLVAATDPLRRFLPSSPTGPRFTAEEADFGKGLHHDVHAPWGMPGPLEQWEAYWLQDDALFRSEMGMPSCSPAAMIRQYAGGLPELPADQTNVRWTHCGSWWIQWEDYLREGGDAQSMDAYVTWTQQRQARALGFATRHCKTRFPAIGGIIFWMGHDCFPCTANNSIIDFHGEPKPALAEIAKVFNKRVPTDITAGAGD